MKLKTNLTNHFANHARNHLNKKKTFAISLIANT